MGPSIWQLLIVLLIVLLLFGTRRLRSLGADLGSAIRGFREALTGEETPEGEKPQGELSQKSPTEGQKGEELSTHHRSVGETGAPRREEL